MTKHRGATPEEDWANGWIEEGLITRLVEEDTGWAVTTEGGWTSLLRKDRTATIPQVGDTFTTFGQIGYPFHGQAINGNVAWYRSIEEEEALRLSSLREADQRKRDRFVADKARLDAAYRALPETFRNRIDKFRDTNPDFRWEFESYEMMCCTDAVKIARYCSVNRIAPRGNGDEPTAADNIVAFSDLPWEEQRKAGISEGHSGNSFGFAVRLAWLYVTHPVMVVEEHGALTPLVGCESYGCPHDRTDPTADEVRR